MQNIFSSLKSIKYSLNQNAASFHSFYCWFSNKKLCRIFTFSIKLYTVSYLLIRVREKLSWIRVNIAGLPNTQLMTLILQWKTGSIVSPPLHFYILTMSSVRIKIMLSTRPFKILVARSRLVEKTYNYKNNNHRNSYTRLNLRYLLKVKFHKRK